MPLQSLVSEAPLAKVTKLAEGGHQGARQLATSFVGQGVGTATKFALVSARMTTRPCRDIDGDPSRVGAVLRRVTWISVWSHGSWVEAPAVGRQKASSTSICCADRTMATKRICWFGAGFDSLTRRRNATTGARPDPAATINNGRPRAASRAFCCKLMGAMSGPRTSSSRTGCRAARRHKARVHPPASKTWTIAAPSAVCACAARVAFFGEAPIQGHEAASVKCEADDDARRNAASIIYAALADRFKSKPLEAGGAALAPLEAFCDIVQELDGTGLERRAPRLEGSAPAGSDDDDAMTVVLRSLALLAVCLLDDTTPQGVERPATAKAVLDDLEQALELRRAGDATDSESLLIARAAVALLGCAHAHGASRRLERTERRATCEIDASACAESARRAGDPAVLRSTACAGCAASIAASASAASRPAASCSTRCSSSCSWPATSCSKWGPGLVRGLEEELVGPGLVVVGPRSLDARAPPT